MSKYRDIWHPEAAKHKKKRMFELKNALCAPIARKTPKKRKTPGKKPCARFFPLCPPFCPFARLFAPFFRFCVQICPSPSLKQAKKGHRTQFGRIRVANISFDPTLSVKRRMSIPNAAPSRFVSRETSVFSRLEDVLPSKEAF